MKLGAVGLLVLLLTGCSSEVRRMADAAMSPENLFDRQIKTLSDRGCPDQLVKALVVQKAAVLEKAAKMNIAKGHLAFLPVIPRNCLDLRELMRLTRNGYRPGVADAAAVKGTWSDYRSLPTAPYYIFEVECGREIDKDPWEVRSEAALSGRRWLSVDEAIALTIQTGVLFRYRVVALGSHCEIAILSQAEKSDLLPTLYIWGDLPRLSCFTYGYTRSDLRFPSCSE